MTISNKSKHLRIVNWRVLDSCCFILDRANLKQPGSTALHSAQQHQVDVLQNVGQELVSRVDPTCPRLERAGKERRGKSGRLLDSLGDMCSCHEFSCGPSFQCKTRAGAAATPRCRRSACMHATDCQNQWLQFVRARCSRALVWIQGVVLLCHHRIACQSAASHRQPFAAMVCWRLVAVSLN
jgi:hypothetical protein